MPYADPAVQREYQRQWAARRRAEYFIDKSCVVCGSTDRLELDHVDPAMKVSHSIWSWSKGRRDAELAKCQILCKTHHQIKTKENLEYSHGEAHGHTILSDEQALQIRAIYAEGVVSLRNLGQQYGVSHYAIWRIVTRRSWSHI